MIHVLQRSDFTHKLAPTGMVIVQALSTAHCHHRVSSRPAPTTSPRPATATADCRCCCSAAGSLSRPGPCCMIQPVACTASAKMGRLPTCSCRPAAFSAASTATHHQHINTQRDAAVKQAVRSHPATLCESAMDLPCTSKPVVFRLQQTPCKTSTIRAQLLHVLMQACTAPAVKPRRQRENSAIKRGGMQHQWLSCDALTAWAYAKRRPESRPFCSRHDRQMQLFLIRMSLPLNQSSQRKHIKPGGAPR